MTELSYGKEARQKILNGVNSLADAVKGTLGAHGRNVSIGMGSGNVPRITKDGVTVADAVKELSDPFEDMGVQLVKQAARRTMALAGDGTTTATVLAQAMIQEGIAKIDDGINPMDLKRGINIATEAIIKNLKSIAVDIRDKPEMLRSIAAIAANNDPELGSLVADLMLKIGRDGYVTIAESKTGETYTSIIDGMQFDRGWIDDSFITNKKKSTVEFINPLILLYDKKISLLADFHNMLKLVIDTARPLLIICEDIDSEALATLTNTKIKNNYPFAAVRAPLGGIEALNDIAVICGCEVISEKKGNKLNSTSIKQMGTAERVVVGKYSTSIIGGAGAKESVSERIDQVKEFISTVTNEFEKEHLNKRLARLSHGFAMFYVGGATDVEKAETMDRVDDTLRATRAAIEEGVVPGGGVAYLRSNVFDIDDHSSEGVCAGIDLVLSAIQSPFRCICENAGEDAAVRLTEVLAGKDDYGYNVKSMEYENFYATGIIDPVKVSRIALENASSVASMLLLTESAIVEVK